MDLIKIIEEAPLPEGYQWGADAMEAFNFGKRCAAEAVGRAIAGLKAPVTLIPIGYDKGERKPVDKGERKGPDVPAVDQGERIGPEDGGEGPRPWTEIMGQDSAAALAKELHYEGSRIDRLSLTELIERSKKAVEAMSPEALAAMRKAQGKSFVRAEMAFGSDRQEAAERVKGEPWPLAEPTNDTPAERIAKARAQWDALNDEGKANLRRLAEDEFKIIGDEWIDVSVVGSMYEEQINLSYSPSMYRHRLRGDDPREPLRNHSVKRAEREWLNGRAPR